MLQKYNFLNPFCIYRLKITPSVSDSILTDFKEKLRNKLIINFLTIKKIQF